MQIPDIGDFADVPVIEIHVSPGDVVAAEDPVLTLESDKATLDIPAPGAGTIDEVLVAVGDRVSTGDVVVRWSESGGSSSGGSAGSASSAPAQASAPAADERPAAASAPAARGYGDGPATPSSAGTAGKQAPEPARAGAPGDVQADVLVLGAGPGGYSAAFRAADLGRKVVLVDKGEALGGVCLNVGCIPSKALLHAAKVIAESKDMADHGVSFADTSIDLDKLRSWKESVVGRLTGGLAGLAKQRKVTTIRGYGRFTSPNQVTVELSDGGTTTVDFEHAIIAAGSEPVTLPFVPHDDPRVIDSTGALEISDVPERLLVLGGGIIGLEMATVYHELGSKVTVVELMDQLIPGADKDLVAPLTKRITRMYEDIHLKTRVTKVEATDEGLVVSFEGPKAPSTDTFDKMLVAVGRKPNGRVVDADKAGVTVDERGFIPVDKQMRTNVGHIFAIGDVVGQPMLAHKAVHEGKVAAEVTAGQHSHFDAKVIPSVAYTDPEVAWVGMTENEAKAAGTKYGKGVFPWAASGRSLSIGRDEGMTKMLFDEESGRLLGAGIVGPAAGDLIAEAGLAIEMGADAADIGMTIHAHPTLSETVGMAAEAFEGTLTDLFLPPKKKK